VSPQVIVAFTISAAVHGLLAFGVPHFPHRASPQPQPRHEEPAPPADAPALEPEANAGQSCSDSAGPKVEPTTSRMRVLAGAIPRGRAAKSAKVPAWMPTPAPDANAYTSRDVSAELSEGDPKAVDAMLYGQGSPARDLSSPPRLGGPVYWDCPWPASADHAGINHAAVLVTVDVAVTGAPIAAHLVRDAGHDFGADAVECAMEYRYHPARERQGRPVAGRTGPFSVLFNRRGP